MHDLLATDTDLMILLLSLAIASDFMGRKAICPLTLSLASRVAAGEDVMTFLLGDSWRKNGLRYLWLLLKHLLACWKF